LFGRRGRKYWKSVEPPMLIGRMPA
jgi:hypothetical protein